jgi:hypothetical protein
MHMLEIIRLTPPFYVLESICEYSRWQYCYHWVGTAVSSLSQTTPLEKKELSIHNFNVCCSVHFRIWL